MKILMSNTKYKTTAIVCRYVMRTKMMSGRALAKQLGIHFTTWHRYARGERWPKAAIKAQLVTIMGLENFTELIQIAFKARRTIHLR